jgi:hypothetical protein
VAGALEAIAALTSGDEAVVLAAVGEQVVVNGAEAPSDATTARLASELRKRNIRAIRLSAGMEAPEAEALLHMLSTDVQQLGQQGGPAAFAAERELAHVEIEEVSYERFVLESDAARDAAPEDVFLQALDSDPSALAETDVTSLVDMLETPQQLANKLVSWLTARGGSGGYGGEGGSGVGPGEGDGIGTGGEIPLVIGGHEVDSGNRAGAILALALQRLGEAVHERSPEEWTATREKLTEVFRSLSVGLQRKVLQADVVAPDAKFDVLESLGGNLDIDEALELLGADAEEAIQDPSVTIERLLGRIAPTQDRLESVAPAARDRLKELGLPDEASSSVVGRLLDALGSRKTDGSSPQLGSFRTDEATREKRRAEGEDLFALLDEDVMWRARVSVCLEVLQTVREAEAYLTALDAVESSLGRIQEGNGRANGIALRVVNALREKQQSPELPRRCRQRTTEALAKLESTGGVESVEAALANASGPERGQLIALLADLGSSGVSALYEMLRKKSCRADLPVILASLARLERDGVKPTDTDDTDDDSDPAAADDASPDDSTEHEQSEEPDFRSLLLDPGWENAAAAVECLAAQSSTFATKYLSISLAQGYLALRAAVVQALTTSPSSEALDLLICALDNSEPDIQEMAAASLGHIRDPRVAVALMKAAEPKGLLDKRTRLRAAAMIALGSLGCTAAYDMLARALRHRALFRREAGAELSAAAATALGRLGTERARAALKRGISDRRPVVQQACHRALAEAAAKGN